MLREQGKNDDSMEALFGKQLYIVIIELNTENCYFSSLQIIPYEIYENK